MLEPEAPLTAIRQAVIAGWRSWLVLAAACVRPRAAAALNSARGHALALGALAAAAAAAAAACCTLHVPGPAAAPSAPAAIGAGRATRGAWGRRSGVEVARAQPSTRRTIVWNRANTCLQGLSVAV